MKADLNAGDFAGQAVSVHLNSPEVRALVEVIREGLITDGQVRLHNFGTFRIKWTRPHRIVHPRTGESMVAPARPRVVFSPARHLRDTVEPNPRPVLPFYDNREAVSVEDAREPVVDPQPVSVQEPAVFPSPPPVMTNPVAESVAQDAVNLGAAEQQVLQRQRKNGFVWAGLGLMALIPAMLFMLQQDVEQQELKPPAVAAQASYEQAGEPAPAAEPVLSGAPKPAVAQDDEAAATTSSPVSDQPELAAADPGPEFITDAPTSDAAAPLADMEPQQLPLSDSLASQSASAEFELRRESAPVQASGPEQSSLPSQASIAEQAAVPAQTSTPQQASVLTQASTPEQASVPPQASVPTQTSPQQQPSVPAPAATTQQISAPEPAFSQEPVSTRQQASIPEQETAPARASAEARVPTPASAVPRPRSEPAVAPAQQSQPAPQTAAATESLPAPEGAGQRIRPGDTLWKLARQRYGDPLLWPAIYGASGALSNPDLLLPGQTVKIPARDSVSGEEFRQRVAAGCFKAYQYYLGESSALAAKWLVAALRWDRDYVQQHRDQVAREHQNII